MATKSKPKHPIQPVVWKEGVIRFKQNALVNYLLDWSSRHGCNMNDLILIDFSRDDRTQFAQLIGYSVSGAGDLPYFDRTVLDAADREAEKLIARKERTRKR